jgi:transketolase
MSNPQMSSAGLAWSESEIRQERVRRLEEAARQLRIDIVKMVYIAGPERKGHPGGALSAADIVAALYFDIMRIDPARPKWPDRDRFILSKGHACPVLYAALACRGYFSKDAYHSFRKVDGMLQGHPDMKGTPGVDMTTGSLGHGLAAGMGMALAARVDHKDYRVFVILSDGECQEGLVWEAAMAAHHYRVDNLIAIVDANRLQSCDLVENTMTLNPLPAKWAAFGWRVIEINGHKMDEVISALDLAVQPKGRPTVIIAQTVKGKGVSYMENDLAWHQKAPNLKQYEQAMAELGEKGGR